MKIKVSEIFFSCQGEARFVGVPSVFLRTFGCNLRCPSFGLHHGEKTTEVQKVIDNLDKYQTYEMLPLVSTGCDSYPSVYPDFKHLSPSYEISDLVDTILKLTPNNMWEQNNGNNMHLVITGGEPLLKGWQKAYAEMLDHPNMHDLKNLTFETNGTQELTPEFRSYLLNWTLNSTKYSKGYARTANCLTFSVSPKLSASGELAEDTIKPENIMSYQEIGHTYLKFVVETVEHVNEAVRVTDQYRSAGFTGDVYLMPQGGVVKSYDENKLNIANICIERGFYYSPRLHVDLYGNGWAK